MSSVLEIEPGVEPTFPYAYSIMLFGRSLPFSGIESS